MSDDDDGLDLRGMTAQDIDRIRWLAEKTGSTHMEAIRAAVNEAILIVVSNQTQRLDMARCAREQLAVLRAGRGQA